MRNSSVERVLKDSRGPVIEVTSSEEEDYVLTKEDIQEQGLLEVLLADNRVNEGFEYFETEIDLCIKALLKRNNLRFRQECSFVLQSADEDGLILDEVQNVRYLVAYVPTVETRANRPIDYYLSKSKQVDSLVTQCLRWVINQSSINLLDLSQEAEPVLIALLKTSGETNDDVIRSVLRILRVSKFDSDRLRVELYNLELYDVRRDVFDEIIPIIAARPEAHVKILMSFNITDSHWMLCEIKILKIANVYRVIPSLLDPQSQRKFTPEQLGKIEAAVRTQIGLLHDGAVVEFIRPVDNDPAPPARQSIMDSTSCGPILIKDWECRLFGRALRVNSYPIGASALRLELLRLVSEELGEDSIESTIIFIDKNLVVQQRSLYENLHKTGKSFDTKKYTQPQRIDPVNITPAKLFGLDDTAKPSSDYMVSSVTLADYLLSTSEDTPQRTHALSVADRAIGLFKECNKNWNEIVEVHALARVPELQIRVNDVFFLALMDEHIVPVQMMLLNGFVEVLRVCLIRGVNTFDQDTILGYLKLINNVLNSLHSKNPNITSLQIVMTGLCRVIDTMVDLKFSGLKKFEIKNPLYECLSKFCSHSDPEISFLAHYAMQGLVRIESNETTSQRVLRKVTLVADALASVGEIAFAVAAAAVSGGAAFANLFKVPKSALVFYQSVDKLISFKIKPSLWYDQLRILDDLLRRPLVKNDPVSSSDKQPKEDFVDDVTWDFYRGFVYKLEVLIERESSVLNLPNIKNCILSIFEKAKELSPADLYTVTLTECKKDKLSERFAELGVQNNVFHLIYVSKEGKKNGKWYYHENMKGKLNIAKKRSEYLSKLPLLANLNGRIRNMSYEQLVQFMTEAKGQNREDATREIAEAFGHEMFSVSDAWIVGRVCNLILKLREKEKLTLPEFETLVRRVEGRFDQLSGITHRIDEIIRQNFGIQVNLRHCRKDALDDLYQNSSHMATHDDHLRCIKDCVTLIILADDELRELYIKDLFARILSLHKVLVGIDSKIHPIKYYKAVTNIQNEIIIALRFLVLHGPEKCREIIGQEITKLVSNVATNKKLSKRIDASGLLNISELCKPQSLSFLGQFQQLISKANDEVTEEKRKKPVPDYVVFKSMFTGSAVSSEDEVDKLLSELRRESELYVPIEAKRNNLGNDSDMHTVVGNFLNPINRNRVLLITGSAGSGKSMFVYNVADELIKLVPDVYNPDWKGYIPILVFLPSLRDPGNLLFEVLRADGSRYHLNEYQVNHLKENSRVLFIFDAVDEMRMPIDIFSTNSDLAKWRYAKFIVTCRFEDREKLGVDYSYVRFSSDIDSFEHYNVSPFSEPKVTEYIDKFVDKRGDLLKKELTGGQEKWQTAEPYKKILIGKGKNGVLCELIDTPLMLSMTMVILPKFENKLEQLQGRGSIVEEYMNLYLQRASRKLRLIKDKPLSLSSIVVNEEMKKICIKFALALHKHGIKQIRFTPMLEITDEELFKDFKAFFDGENPGMKYLMAAVPLAQVETLTYQFKHERFRVHFFVEGTILKDRNTDPRTYAAEIPEDAMASLVRNRAQLTKDVKSDKEEAVKFDSDDEVLDM